MVTYREGDVNAIFGENVALNIGSDRIASGNVRGGATVGEDIAFSELLYLNNDGKWYKAMAMDGMLTKAMALDTVKKDQTCNILIEGIVRNNNWSFMTGMNLYSDMNTSGAISMATPTDFRQYIGLAISRNVILFRPESNFNYGSSNRTTLKDLNTDVNALFERQTYNLQYLVVAPGEYIFVESGRHPRLKITNAFAQLADNSDREQVIQLFTGSEAISDPLHLHNTESMGKAQLIEIGLMDDLIPFWKDIRVTATTGRHTIINLHVQSYEGE